MEVDWTSNKSYINVYKRMAIRLFYLLFSPLARKTHGLSRGINVMF